MSGPATDGSGSLSNDGQLDTTVVNETVLAVRALADDYLFPNANAVDESGEIPTEGLRELKSAGLYGLNAPAARGGMGADRSTALAVLEALAGGCLTTTFVWTQHTGATLASLGSDGPMNALWADRLIAGDARGGVAFAHLLRGGPPVLTATASSDGWVLNGKAPFVTGWGHIDALLVGAVHEEPDLAPTTIWGILPVDAEARASADATLGAQRLHLAAVDATHTYELTFRDHPLTAEQVTKIQPLDAYLAEYRLGLRSNGALPLGVTGRCLRLLGPSLLDDEFAAVRHTLDTAGPDALPDARAAATELGMRAASALVSSIGGSAVMRGHNAQRLAREALFLLVQGQNATIKASHQRRFGVTA